VDHPRPPQHRPDRLLLADPPVHRPGRRDPVRPRRPGPGRRGTRRARWFDATGASFTRQGDRGVFEVLLDHFQLDRDAALARLAHIVHAAEVTADLETDPLAPGLAAICVGGLDAEANDQWLVERGMFVYDALYAWCQRHADLRGPRR